MYNYGLCQNFLYVHNYKLLVLVAEGDIKAVDPSISTINCLLLHRGSV